jgi:hypothetical protein
MTEFSGSIFFDEICQIWEPKSVEQSVASCQHSHADWKHRQIRGEEQGEDENNEGGTRH